MIKIKIKLTYDELMAIDYILTCNGHLAIDHLDTYHAKATMALLIEWWLAKLKPRTYIRYSGSKSLTLTLPVACALMFYYHRTDIVDPYVANVWRSIALTIDPLIPRL